MPLSIDQDLLVSELDTLASFSEVPPPAVTRILFSEPDLRARAYIKKLCADAGLDVRCDAIGNMFARWEGTRKNEPAVATGSHIDAIPNAGRYDGTVGVLGGLEAIRALRRAGFLPQRSIELIIFTSEEPTRFGIGCLGSRLLAGTLDASADEALRDQGGRTVKQLRNEAGFGGDLRQVRLAAGHYSGFVELHIEQGPTLEREGVSIGVVTAIAAPASLRITIEGEGGHAGAVLMAERRDALCAAAELVLAVEAAAKATRAPDTVATTGVCTVFPSAVNSVPSRVQLEIDIRDIDGDRRQGVLLAVENALADICQRRRVRHELRVVNADPPGKCDPGIVRLISQVSADFNVSHRHMVSRAYHDSLFMSRIAPTAMIFIPCRNGVSHRPDEYAAPADIGKGTRVLAETLAQLAVR